MRFLARQIVLLVAAVLAHPAPPPAVSPSAGLEEAALALERYLEESVDQVAFRVVDRPADTSSGLGRPTYIGQLVRVSSYAETPNLTPPGVTPRPPTRGVTFEIERVRAYRGALNDLPPAREADIDHDGAVGLRDLELLLAEMDGPVGAAHLAAVIAAWGE